jgi:hypothetical protein
MLSNLPANLKELLSFRQVRAFVRGESYWTVVLTSGKTLSELDTKHYVDGNKVLRLRTLEWKEDLINSGDVKNIKEVQLHTPEGTAHLTAIEPYTVFQFSRGVMNMMGSEYERVKNCQVVGVLINKETGECECAVWDAQTRQLYTMFNNVKHFVKWREGIADVGRLNIEAMDLRGIGP